jgi:hypothetical protein
MAPHNIGLEGPALSRNREDLVQALQFIATTLGSVAEARHIV